MSDPISLEQNPSLEPDEAETAQSAVGGGSEIGEASGEEPENTAAPREESPRAEGPAPMPENDLPDPDEGEYRYKSGYTQRIYADAHFAPASEDTVPPRYYTPPRRPVKESAEKPKKKGAFLKIACLCLCFALLGSLAGGALVGWRLNQRLDEIEDAGSKKNTVVIGADSGSGVQKLSTADPGRPLAQLYEQACQQAVGISTEVTYQNFFGQTSTSAVTGSGFIISEDGYILTNYHVIEYADLGGYEISVILHDGTRYEASIVGSEKSNDVAVLKIDANGLTPVTLGNSDEILVGDEVHAVGNPLGELEFSMTNGHISALDRVITTDSSGDEISMFQFDAAVNKGNSGGPLYDSEGRVVGIVTAKYSSAGVEGLGFAIPINDAVRIAQDLIDNGYVTGKAYLGVIIDNQYNAMLAQYYELPLGAYVKSVESGSCAEKAGLHAGDVIIRLGDRDVEGYNDLKQALKAWSAGDTAEIEISRAGKTLQLEVVFDEMRPSH